MRVTLRAPIVLTFRSAPARRAAFVLLAAVRGAIVSYFVFVAFVYPLTYLQWLRGPLIAVAMVLNLPISWLSFLVPLGWPLAGGIAWHGFAGLLLQRHMIAGVVAYVLLFHIPAVVRLIHGRSITRLKPGR